MEQFQQVEISQVSKLRNAHTALRKVWSSGHYHGKGTVGDLQIPKIRYNQSFFFFLMERLKLKNKNFWFMKKYIFLNDLESSVYSFTDSV